MFILRSDWLALLARRRWGCGRASAAFLGCASLLRCPVSMPLGTDRVRLEQPLCGQQLTLRPLEIRQTRVLYAEGHPHLRSRPLSGCNLSFLLPHNLPFFSELWRRFVTTVTHKHRFLLRKSPPKGVEIGQKPRQAYISDFWGCVGSD